MIGRSLTKVLVKVYCEHDQKSEKYTLGSGTFPGTFTRNPLSVDGPKNSLYDSYY